MPTGAVSLGTIADTAQGETISGQLGSVDVNDTRGGPSGAGWIVTVTATAFSPTSGAAIPASAVSYSAGSTQTRGTASYTDNRPSNISTAVAVVTATGINGDDAEVTWNPTISVAVPGGSVAGIYTSTITHSVE